MPKMFRVTYEIVTPESAEHGDVESRGFMLKGDWRIELRPEICGPAAGAVKDSCALTLREAVDLVSPGAMEDSGTWFTEMGERLNYRTGESEVRSFHMPDNITPSSYARLKRALGAV